MDASTRALLKLVAAVAAVVFAVFALTQAHVGDLSVIDDLGWGVIAAAVAAVL